MNELPPGWAPVELGDVISGFETGRNFKASSSPARAGEYGVLKISAVTWGRFQPAENKALLHGDSPIPHELVRAGDLLVSRANTTELVGAPVLVGRDHPQLMLPDKILRVLYDERVIDRRFLLYALRTRRARAYIEMNATGTSDSMRNLSQPKLRGIPLALAPLPEQKRIADKLDALLARVDDCRGRLDRVPGILKRARQSVLSAATSGELTREWREKKGVLGVGRAEHPEVLDEHGGWPSRDLPLSWQWIGFNEYFDDSTDSRRKLPQSAYDTSGPFAVIDQGEALIGGYTTRAELRSLATLPVIVFGDHTRCIKYVDVPFVQGADGVRVLSPRPEVVAASFAYLALRACELPDKGYSRHMRFLRASYFPRPPLDEQVEIVRRAGELLRLVDDVQMIVDAARARVARLTSSVLANAFRGELVPQDPNDEPAAVLLGRVRGRSDVASSTRKPHIGGVKAKQASNGPLRTTAS